ncbi:ASKHA domain-containing protein [Desulfobacula sp.]|uniref:ASKHA domain-containing protein n=1 Tax=Desulfobacula sp. TaxID=2593537 RepID=UPI0026165A42|nr:ASKHA domain-containing protein [Desulfobacula sp.]
MPNVTFKNLYTTIKVPVGTSIMDAARMADLPIESPCNQTGVCGKCRVKLSHGANNHILTPEDTVLHPTAVSQGWVLACQTRILKDIEIDRLPNIHTVKDPASVLDHGHCDAKGFAPAISKKFDPKKNLTEIFTGHDCIGTEPGDTREHIFGMAVDIGTTTLVASLIDLKTSREKGSVSALNPQANFAQDVLSRIKFADTQKGLQTLQNAFVTCLNQMVGTVCNKTGIQPNNIYESVFSGNTCMLHLACGVSPVSLGRYPYTPEITGNQTLKAADIGLELATFARVYLPPVISAYVGADLTSGILGLMLHKRSGISLLVDIGTNGEIILAENGRLMATSTAAGPALEGMNISCGMVAGPGAIERVSLSDTGHISLSTIADGEPQGLCGSGLIDLVAELVRHGVLLPTGRLAAPDAKEMDPHLLAALSENSKSRQFNVSKNVHLTQKDVRQVQLAKGAIQAGIAFLLKETGISPEQVDQVLIAGAFGYHLSADGLIRIKLLPEVFKNKVSYVGNTSKTGAQAFLTNTAFREEMDHLVKTVQVVELSGHPEFEQTFIRCLGF